MESDAPMFDPDEQPPSPEEYDDRPPCEVFEQAGERGFMMARDGGGSCTPPWDLEPEQRTSAPLAQRTPGVDPLWPISTNAEHMVRVSYRDVRGKWHGKWGYHVGSKRKGDDGTMHHHSGVDLYANEGDPVVAMEDGEVIAMLPFHHDTWSVYVRNSDGKIVNYGEVEKNSWMDYGLPMQILEGETTEPAQKRTVKAGQTIGRVGRQSGGSTMLHFETYAPDITVSDIRAGNLQWPYGENAPAGLLDPSGYLVAAQHTWFFTQGEDVS